MKSITKSQFFLICILVLNVFMVDVSSDIFSPAIPHIQDEFKISVFMAEALVGFSVMWLGISALFYGILSDRFGRKKATLLGLILFLIGAICSARSNTINQFLIGRNLQGLGSGFALAIGIAVLRDMFQEEMFVKITSIIGAVLLFVPVLAPIAGSYLTLFYGWRSTFYFVIALSVIALILNLIVFRETKPSETATSTSSLVTNICSLLSTKKYILYVVINSFATACIWLVINFMPYIMQSQYHQSIQSYGISLGAALLSGVIGALLNTKLIDFFSEKSLLKFMLGLSLIAGITIYVSNFIPYSQYIALLGASLYFFAAAFVFPITSDLALSHVDENVIGLASSVLTMIEMVFSGLMLLLSAHYSPLLTTYTTLLALGVMICMCTSIYLFKNVENQKAIALEGVA